MHFYEDYEHGAYKSYHFVSIETEFTVEQLQIAQNWARFTMHLIF